MGRDRWTGRRTGRLGPRLLAVLTLFAAGPAGAHDMFLVVPDHDVAVGAEVVVALYNGTFDESLNVIDRERMADVTVVDGRGAVSHPPAESWTEEGDETRLPVQAGVSGTWLVGVSTLPRVLELTAEEFDEYLEHDGVLDVLEARRADPRPDAVRERYSKHVKTILTVGGESSESWGARLGYPIEIVPLADPAVLTPGDELEVLVLHDGQPAAGQLLHASHEGYHGHSDTGGHREAVTTRTDDAGKARIDLSHAGRWYARLIRMLPSPEDDVDYESVWATLTFEIAR